MTKKNCGLFVKTVTYIQGVIDNKTVLCLHENINDCVQRDMMLMLHFTIQRSEQSEIPSLCCFLNELPTKTGSINIQGVH